MVQAIDTRDALDKLLNDADQKLVMIDFFATWCPPCRAIAPKIEDMAKDNPDVIFCKVDVDEIEDEVMKAYKVSAMPTFVFIKAKNVVDTVVGAAEAKIKEALIKHK